MIIEKIDIKSFGQLIDTSLEFSDSVNVIEGQNEAGKSTIAAFIRYMLYGFDGTEQEGVVSERKKRLNWTTGIAQGSMVVRVKDKRYLVSRSTVPVEEGGRTTYKEDSSIIDMETGTTAFGKLPAGEVFFGAGAELFTNTAFVGQIGDTAINEGSVKESIENILFSGSERINNQRASARIAEKMEGLYHSGGHGGAIVDLSRKREELEAALLRSDEDNKQILAKETELYRIRSERSDAEDKLEKLHDLDNCYKNVMLIQTFDKLHELEEESAAKADVYNKFIEANTRSGYVPTEQYLTDIAVSRRAVNDSYRTLVEAEEAYSREKNAAGITNEIQSAIEKSDGMGGESAVVSRADGHRKSFFTNLTLAVLCALGAVASLVVEIAGTGTLALLAFRILFGVVGVAALVGVVFFVMRTVKANKAQIALASFFGVSGYQDLKGKIYVISEARAKRDGMIRSTESARVALERAVANYDTAKTELTRVIVRWGEEPPTTELNEFLDKLESRVSAFLEERRVLLEDKNSIELTVREIRRTLSDKNEIDVRGQVAPLKRKALSKINHDEIVTGIAAYRARIAEQDKLAYTVESDLMALKAHAGDPGDYYSSIHALDERIAELEERHQAYSMAAEVIATASEDLRTEISPRLGEYATNLMSVMTDKKYSGFAVGESLDISFTSVAGGERSVDFLSGGTRDLAYIAVRMALVDMLYSEKPPICFDETFAHQDNLRADAMMRALSSLAEDGYQSFVFTCRGREAVLAQEVVKNPGIYKLSAPAGEIPSAV